MQSKLWAITLAVVIILGGFCMAIVYSQLLTYDAQMEQLKNENMKLQTQNNSLQEEINVLQLQKKEEYERLKDFTYQLALERSLKVGIIGAKASPGGSPIVGVTLSYPVNVTVHNSDVVPLCGLVAAFIYVDKDSGARIGDGGQATFDRIDAGESMEVTGSVYLLLDTNLDNAVCKITLSVGNVVLDNWTQELSKAT